jgi:dTDP-4-amino-4,6-dideoxygalactose transaminase
VRNGDNRRLTEFQGALLLAQLTRLEEQAKTREQNAGYLTKMLREIPGITPAKMYEGCTRNAYHIYMLRYDANHFSGLARERFLKALRAEGIPCSSGYTPLIFGRAQPLPPTRPVVSGSRLVFADRVARRQTGYGSDRRSDQEDS